MKRILLFFFILFLGLSEAVTIGSPIDPILKKEQVTEVMNRVADYQIEHFTYLPYTEKGNHHDYGIDAWTNAVFYMGLSEWVKMEGDRSSYYDWLLQIGQANNWALPANFAQYPKYLYYHADELCMGQFYLNMYEIDGEEKLLKAVQERADWIMANPSDTSRNYRNKQSWSWCDALFMAPPVYAGLSKVTGKREYLYFMHDNFLHTYEHLYNRKYSLFFRDDSYFDKKEANGMPIFWGRGNGWVLAGLVNVMKLLPAETELNPFYENLFVSLASCLSSLQDENGFWHASLLDPQSYPTPETSATALIIYGLVYGINNGLLADSYRPIVERGWDALVSVVNEDGRLGFVQPIGADPKKVTGEMTAVYGAGAFLLAGTEFLKMINGH